MKAGEFFAGKFSGAVEKGAVEIFVQRDLARVECGKLRSWRSLKFFVVEIECVAGGFAGVAIPAVGEG